MKRQLVIALLLASCKEQVVEKKNCEWITLSRIDSTDFGSKYNHANWIIGHEHCDNCKCGSGFIGTGESEVLKQQNTVVIGIGESEYYPNQKDTFIGTRQ